MASKIGTPYVTPHILHRNYAQASDSELWGNNRAYATSTVDKLTLTVSF